MKSLLLVILALAFSCKNSPSITHQSQSNQIVIDKAKTYTNFGFRFTIPKSFQITVDAQKSENLKGELKMIETDFVSPATNEKIRLLFHSTKSGMDLFQYYSNNLKKYKATTLNIAGLPAVKYQTILNKDGKGNNLPPTQRVHVILQNRKNGNLEIVFDSPANNYSESVLFTPFLQAITLE